MNSAFRSVLLFAALVVGLSLACSACGMEKRVIPVPPMKTPGTGGSSSAAWWVPEPGTTWQWQLTGELEPIIDSVEMYDVDLFDTSVDQIQTLHDHGIVVVCYFSAGTAELWRADVQALDEAGELEQFTGAELPEWKGELWFDLADSRVNELMLARLDLAVSKGCDAVEPDNVDGYLNWPDTISVAQELEYLQFLATETHARGLSIGLKNAVELIDDLVGEFDWALNESCLAHGHCDAYTPFFDAGKAVFHTEYAYPASADHVACTDPSREGMSTLVKKKSLDSWAVFCAP